MDAYIHALDTQEQKQQAYWDFMEDLPPEPFVTDDQVDEFKEF